VTYPKGGKVIALPPFFCPEFIYFEEMT